MSAYFEQNGFKCDADYFEIQAQQSPTPEERQALKQIAKTYRALAKTDTTFGTRQEQWRKRAEECRTLADQFQTEMCRKQLMRLADAYDMLAGADIYTGDELLLPKRPTLRRRRLTQHP